VQGVPYGQKRNTTEASQATLSRRDDAKSGGALYSGCAYINRVLNVKAVAGSRLNPKRRIYRIA
jgi:hypothetical protein